MVVQLGVFVQRHFTRRAVGIAQELFNVTHGLRAEHYVTAY
jgi:hypothetical protein